MIGIHFSAEAVERLRKERFEHPHPRVQRKMETLLLKSQGLSHKQIAEIVGISENTLRQYLREYQEGGVERLKEFHYPKPQSELMEHRESLETYFEEHPPASVKEAAAAIEKIAGIRRGETQVRKFLHSLGLKPRKVGMIPAKADVEEQERFKKRVGASFSGGEAGQAGRVLRGCGAFRVGAVFGILMDAGAAVHQGSLRPTAFQRSGRPQRRDA